MRFSSLLALATLLAPGLQAQTADTLFVDLDALQVTATRVSETAATAPLAVALEVRSPLELDTQPAASLEQVLRHLPGLWVSDRENMALGERLSVRGMGARAGFGVRGVQVVMDGIPLTMPDGQSAMIISDPALIRRAELIRGPAAALWGNASGGVLLLNTIPSEARLARARVLGGSFGLVRTDAEIALPFGRQRGGLAVTHLRRDGFREYSAFEVTRGRAFGSFDLGDGARLAAVGAFEWAPEQQHPGALTAEELAADPRQAQPAFVAQSAGKDSRQGQLGLALTAPTRLGTVTASGFGLARRLENPLPFAVIDVDRLAAGSRLALERRDGHVRWAVGFDSGVQRDDRRNWVNEAGERGDLRLDQLETVSAFGAFARATVENGNLTLSAGLRGDRTRFAAKDRFADNSGDRVLAAWSPSAGASYRLGTALAFVSLGTAFETPTTTELVNRPDGGTGFNPDIEPQRTRGVEAGFRGTDARGRLFYDLAAYRLEVTDQLTPFEGSDGRTYYRNAEETRHDGVEALVEYRASRALTLGATYAWSRFVFSGASGALNGSRLPGVPEHRGAARARLAIGSAFVHADLLAAGPTWADDENTARADGFVTLDVRVGHRGVATGGAVLTPFLQVQNVTDAAYAGSVALNARGGRFFEPAAGRALQLGLSARLAP
jgi:iron complex outermembrane recepter protein